MSRREESVSAGTKSIAPVTIGKLPVFVAGIPTPTIQDSLFAQSADGHSAIVGVGASVNAAQVANAPAFVYGEGASAWGDGAIAIGKNVAAGVTAAKDGCIMIGDGGSNNNKGKIRIGSDLAFGGTAGDDAIAIGTQTTASQTGHISIGKGATGSSVDGVNIGTSSVASEGASVAVGKGASCPNSGLGTPNRNIAIGDGAGCAPTFASTLGGVIAIGVGAVDNGQNCVVIGPTAAIAGAGIIASIAIGAGAVSARSSEAVFGDNVAGPITLVSVRAGAGIRVKHRSGGAGGWGIRDNADANDIFVVDESATAGDIRLLVWDTTAGILKRVTMAPANALPGVGFRSLMVPV